MTPAIVPLQVSLAVVSDLDIEQSQQKQEEKTNQSEKKEAVKDDNNEVVALESAQSVVLKERTAHTESIVETSIITPKQIVKKELKQIQSQSIAKPATVTNKNDIIASTASQRKNLNSIQSNSNINNKNALRNKVTAKNKTYYSEPSEFTDAIIKNEPKKCYPRISQMRGEKGVAILRISIDSKGSTGQINLTQSTGFPMLDECAKQSVAQSKYYPAMQSGVPVSSTRLVKIVFEP